jgi:hypothetical protein
MKKEISKKIVVTSVKILMNLSYYFASMILHKFSFGNFSQNCQCGNQDKKIISNLWQLTIQCNDLYPNYIIITP